MNSSADTVEISDSKALAPLPLVSVYMLAYRHEKFIQQAIEGVIAQQCNFPIELIIGEDCSPDKTREIATSYQQRYPHLIRVLTTERNIGSKANSVRCRAATRGNYVAICEGDDYWTDPTKLMRQIEVFRANVNCSLVFHNARKIDANSGRKVGGARWSLCTRKFSTEELILGDGGMVPTASIMVKKTVLQQLPTWARAAPIGDYPLVLSAALFGEVIYIDRCMSVYRINVPHSWTERHAPKLAHRYKYAREIETMLTGPIEKFTPSEQRAVRTMISKYYSDVVVRIEGLRQEQADIYRKARHKMRGTDRLLAWIAVKLNIRLPWVKDVIRKTKTLLRLIKAHFQRSLKLSDRLAR